MVPNKKLVQKLSSNRKTSEVTPQGMTEFANGEFGEFFNRFCGAQTFAGTFGGYKDFESYKGKKNSDEESPLFGKKLKRSYIMLTEKGEVLFDESIKPLARIFRNKGLGEGARLSFEYLGVQNPKSKTVYTEPLDEKQAEKLFPKVKSGDARAFLKWGKLLAEITK